MSLAYCNQCLNRVDDCTCTDGPEAPFIYGEIRRGIELNRRKQSNRENLRYEDGTDSGIKESDLPKVVNPKELQTEPKEQELRKEFNNLFANEERYLFYTDADDPTEVECANEVFNFFTPHLATVEHDKKLLEKFVKAEQKAFSVYKPSFNKFFKEFLTQEGLVESEGLK